jgi:hypothetical protein
VEALEDAEDPLLILHVEADPLVGHRHHHEIAVPI